MSDTGAQLVIEISPSESSPHATRRRREKVRSGGLGSELRRCLQPGVEIALAFPGYTAVMAVVWISERQHENIRAGVRLLGVSALPDE